MEISTSLPHVEHVMDGKKDDSRGRAILIKALSVAVVWFANKLFLSMLSGYVSMYNFGWQTRRLRASISRAMKSLDSATIDFLRNQQCRKIRIENGCIWKRKLSMIVS